MKNVRMFVASALAAALLLPLASLAVEAQGKGAEIRQTPALPPAPLEADAPLTADELRSAEASLRGVSFGDILTLGTKVATVIMKFQAGAVVEETIRAIKIGGKRGDLKLVWTPRPPRP